MTESKSDESIFGGGAFHFRIALKRIEYLNAFFPDLYDSHREQLAELLRKKIGIRDEAHQKEIVDIINKKFPNLMFGDQLTQLEHLDSSIVLFAPELKNHNLKLPMRFSNDPIQFRSFSMRTFLGSSPDFLREMSLVFLIAKFEAFLKNMVSVAYNLKSNSIGKELPPDYQVRIDPEYNKDMIYSKFGIDISKLAGSEESWKLIKERFYRRNLLVHKGNVPDEKYKELTRTTSDDPLKTDEDYLDEILKLFFDFPDKIQEEFEKKYEQS